MSLLEVENLSVVYRSADGAGRPRLLTAVNGVSFALEAGESLGLVGESGCGKSSLGRALLGLERAQAGRIRFAGQEVDQLRGAALQRFRRQAQMVFQDPFDALNPRLTIGGAIAEVLLVHRLATRAQCSARVAQLLELVGLDPRYGRRYPHEFSGGQRQRIGIARALAVEPRLLVADEPVSALDVSVQAQILNLLQDLRQRLNFACLFIAHDLAVVQYMCARIMVMYRGRIVEAGPAKEMFARPAHPYTAALLAAVPDVDQGLQRRRAPAALAIPPKEERKHDGASL